jgi:DUF177 domain-containing protein
MHLDLHDLPLRGGERYESACALEMPPVVLGGTDYRVLLPDGATVGVDRVAGGFLVGISADAKVYGPCARCLKEVVLNVRAEEEEFAPTAAGGWKESDTSPLIDDLLVDVAGMVREAIVLALPSQILCSPSCKGLCSQCGRDLNQGECGCGALEISQPMG